MDFTDIPRNWFENQLENTYLTRRSFLISDKPTATERYRIKDLLHAADKELSITEKQKRVLRTRYNNEKNVQGSQGKNITSSFETLLFWYKMLERKLGSYSKKVAVETEFVPRVRITKRRMKILIKRSSIISK